jgi:hypothetical protein
MNRVTAHLDLNRNELEWLVGYANAHDLSIHAAARHAIRVLNLMEETPGAWDVVEALRAKVLGPKCVAAPQQVLSEEKQQESAQRLRVVALLDKLSAHPELAPELNAVRQVLAVVLFPEGSEDYRNFIEGAAPESGRLNAVQRYEACFGSGSQEGTPVERIAGRKPGALLDLDTSLEA